MNSLLGATIAIAYTFLTRVNKVEQILGFKVKSDIEKFGIEYFIEERRKFSAKFIDIISEQVLQHKAG